MPTAVKVVLTVSDGAGGRRASVACARRWRPPAVWAGVRVSRGIAA